MQSIQPIEMPFVGTAASEVDERAPPRRSMVSEAIDARYTTDILPVLTLVMVGVQLLNAFYNHVTRGDEHEDWIILGAYVYCFVIVIPAVFLHFVPSQPSLASCAFFIIIQALVILRVLLYETKSYYFFMLPILLVSSTYLPIKVAVGMYVAFFVTSLGTTFAVHGKLDETTLSFGSSAVVVMVIVFVSAFLAHRRQLVFDLSKERFQMLLDGCYEGILLLDGDLIVQANEGFAVHLRCAGMDVVGSKITDWFAPRYHEDMRGIIADHTLTHRLLEAEAVRPDGTTFNCGLAICYQGSKLQGGLTVVSLRNVEDFNEIKLELQSAVKGQLEMREKAAEDGLKRNEMQARFISCLGREISVPASAISSVSEMMLKLNLDGEVMEHVTLLNEASQMLLSIAGDIAHVERFDDKGDLAEMSFSVENLISSALNEVAQEAFSKRIELLMTVSPRVPSWIMSNPARYKQILTHLLSNAITFTNEGHVHVHVSVLDEEDEDDPELEVLADEMIAKRQAIPTVVCTEVIDTGIGIHPDELETIFVVKEDKKGGLGLAITERLTQSLGGEMTLKSEIGVGTHVTFTIEAKSEVVGTTLPISLPPDIVDVRCAFVYRSTRVLESARRLLTSWGLQVQALSSPTMIESCDIVIVESALFDETIATLNKRQSRERRTHSILDSHQSAESSLFNSRGSLATTSTNTERGRQALLPCIVLSSPLEMTEPPNGRGLVKVYPETKPIDWRNLRGSVVAALRFFRAGVSSVLSHRFSRISCLVIDSRASDRYRWSHIFSKLDCKFSTFAKIEDYLHSDREEHDIPEVVFLEFPDIRGSARNNWLALVQQLMSHFPEARLVICASDTITNLQKRAQLVQAHGVVQTPACVPEVVSVFASTRGKQSRTVSQSAASMQSDHATTVLWADDNPLNLVVMELMFQQEGIIVLKARHGLETVDTWKANSDTIDVIVMSKQMPRMDGLLATKKIRELERENQRARVRIILACTDASQATHKACLNAGADAIVLKPPDWPVILNLIRA